MIRDIPILVVRTVTKLDQTSEGTIVIGGSHAAPFTTFLTLKARAHAAILHDAGIGLEEAGVGGLRWAEQFGFAMAAVDGRTARIGDGDDMLQRGRISRVNRFAKQCGVEIGMSCEKAAKLLRDARAATSWPEQMQETRHVVSVEGLDVVTVDSVALARESDRGKIIATGSHGGQPSAGYAGRISPKMVLFNDASFGVDHAGIACFPILDELGIAAASVSSFTARIGDGRSTLMDGVVSALNRNAARMGACEGSRALQLVTFLTTKGSNLCL
ncbi:hypothetical protein [Devosia naphthalenivorans]|uniref:hypothetical protein n=1 Tax=Devosia naphthalenivorans TaxID=2082392 RepID=UPI000D383E1C|nr:hypothetical protein [Devosia naphthalenivorans]